jgi:flagellar protein FlaJ
LTSIRLGAKPNARALSKASKPAKPKVKDDNFGPQSLFSREATDFDLVSQLTHMAAVSTAGISRDKLFEGTANLDYSTSKYFRRVHRVAQRLGYDYSKACEVVADQARIETVQNLLLHFATALSAGESEEEFLARETEVQLDVYGKRYERDMESLRKWTDAYVALMVSTTLIIVISLVSMMIYPLGSMIIVGLAFIVMMVTAVGGYIIFTVAPHEVKTHRLKRRSHEQQRMEALGKVLIIMVGPIMAALWLVVHVGLALIVGGIVLMPLAYLAYVDDRKIDRRDGDLAAFLRGLGSVMGAVGTTVTEGLSRMNRRSLGAMEPHVRRLFVRLKNDLSSELTWARLAGESGSELVTRCVRIFSEGIRLGGDPKIVGNQAAAFALKVSQMRQTRSMIANTFAFVVLPMHAALVCILLFVMQVIAVFGDKISQVQSENINSETVRQAGVSTAISFAAPDMGFIGMLVSLNIVLLTLVNSFAPYAAGGGHRYGIFKFAFMMMIISGVAMLVVPWVVGSLFSSVAAPPTAGTVPR